MFNLEDYLSQPEYKEYQKRLEEQITKELPKNAIELIKETLLKIPKRKTYELLLVSAGVKPGDKIERLTPKESRNFFKKQLESLKEIIPEINYITDSIGEIIYFNEDITTKELALECKNIFEKNLNGQVEAGLFYGYPINCCIQSCVKHEDNMTFHEYTEHLWCKPDCEESKKMQRLYKKTLKENNLMNLGSWWK